VSGAQLGEAMKRWNENGTVLQTFSNDYTTTFKYVIELKRDVIVASSDDSEVIIWKVTTGERLHSDADFPSTTQIPMDSTCSEVDYAGIISISLPLNLVNVRT